MFGGHIAPKFMGVIAMSRHTQPPAFGAAVVSGGITPGPASDSQNVTHVTTLASPKDAAATKLLPVPVAAEPSDLRRQLRASTLIYHLLDAELHYALSSNTIMLTFRTPAAAGGKGRRAHRAGSAVMMQFLVKFTNGYTEIREREWTRALSKALEIASRDGGSLISIELLR